MDLADRPDLPHGRLWVANQGCTCRPCTAARTDAAHAAKVERDRAPVKPPTAEQLRAAKRQRPHWVRMGKRSVVAAPVGALAPGDVVRVHKLSTMGTAEIKLGRKIVTPFQADGVPLDRFEPDRS